MRKQQTLMTEDIMREVKVPLPYKTETPKTTMATENTQQNTHNSPLAQVTFVLSKTHIPLPG